MLPRRGHIVNQFDPNIPSNLEGEFTLVEVLSPPNFSVGQGNRVIDASKPFDIHVKWKLEGAMVGLWLAANSQWTVSAYAESIGAGPERKIGQSTVPAQSPSNTFELAEYETTITVAPGQLPENNPGGTNSTSGVYKLALVAFLNVPVSGPYDVAGFYEIPLVLSEVPE